MSIRSFAVAVLAAATLTSCDLISDLQPEPAAEVPVTQIRIADIPLAPNRTREWDDDGTGPDVFVEIQNTAGAAIVRSDVIPDADLTQPLTFSIPETPEASSSQARLFVVAFDADGNDIAFAESLGSSQSFSAEELVASDGSLFLRDWRFESAGREATYEVFR